MKMSGIKNKCNSVEPRVCQLGMRNSTRSPIASDFQPTVSQENETPDHTTWSISANDYNEKFTSELWQLTVYDSLVNSIFISIHW